MAGLLSKLTEYSKGSYYPFHMPGHKRNIGVFQMGDPYQLDITEIDGFDNLHEPTGVLKELQDRAAAVYHAEESYLLVNGSTAGILAGISACVRHGDTVLVARNSHRSVYHAILINELRAVYVYPQEIPSWGINGAISPDDVDNLLKENPAVSLVVITSPTYEGIISDIAAISRITHQYGIPLLVDAAHGAHLGFHSYFPQNSIKQGADLVIHSIHKTLPAFTQTALLHCNGTVVNRRRVRENLSIFQTSSPSYLLMAGADQCISFLEAEKNDSWKQFSVYAEQLRHFYREAEKMRHIKILNMERESKDPSKLILSVRDTSMTGEELYGILRDRYQLQMEAQMTDYVIAMTSPADTEEGFRRLLSALLEIDSELDNKQQKIQGQKPETKMPVLPRLPYWISAYETSLVSGYETALWESEGCISKEYAYFYPPGIPLIVPGEQITEELLSFLKRNEEKGLSVQGLREKGKITVAYKRRREDDETEI